MRKTTTNFSKGMEKDTDVFSMPHITSYLWSLVQDIVSEMLPLSSVHGCDIFNLQKSVIFVATIIIIGHIWFPCAIFSSPSDSQHQSFEGNL